MKLKEAIKKFERGRTSCDDYYCIGYNRPNVKCCSYRQLNGKEIKQCGEVNVIKYKEFEGHVMSFSLATLKMGKDRKCRAVSIRLDPDQTEIQLYGLESYPKPKRKRKSPVCKG